MIMDTSQIKVGLQTDVTSYDSPVHSLPLEDVLEKIATSEPLKVLTDRIQGEQDKDKRDALKRKLPAIIISADTRHRKPHEDDHLNGLILMDIDGKDHPDILLDEMIERVEKMVENHPFVIGYCKSVSWKGLKVLCGIEPSAETHQRSFMALEQLFAEYGLIVDRQCKDLKRVNFLAHDPLIHDTLTDRLRNWGGETVVPVPPKEKKQYKIRKPQGNEKSPDEEAGLCLQHLDPDMDYEDWLAVGMGLKAHGCSCGIFSAWSSGGQTYKEGEPERKWNSFKGTGIGFGTVVNMAKANNGGVNPVRPAKKKSVATVNDFDVVDDMVEGDEKKRKLPAVTDADSLMTVFPTKPECLIEGVLGVGDKLILSASSKAGKTWLMLHLAYAAQNGDNWLGHQCKKMDVLYVNFELTEAWLAERFRLISRDKPFQEPPSVLNLRGYNVCWSELSEHIKEHIQQSDKNYGLIILDPIYKMLGDTDENSNGEVAMLLNALERMGHETKTATAFSHHHSKGNKSGVDAIERMSGAGVWGREPDAIIDLTAHEEEDCWVVDTTTRNFSKPPKVVVRCEFPNFVPVDDCDPDDLRKAGGSRKKLTESNVLDMCRTVPLGINRAELVNKLSETYKISKQAARSRVSEMTKNDKLWEDGKLIRIVDENQPF